MKILFCGDAFPDGPDYLERNLPLEKRYELVVCPHDDIRPMLDGVDVVVPRMGRVGRREMERGSFKLVQQWGAGLEGVDLQAARELGISVANVPATGGNAESVAEHAILLILALLRDLPLAQENARRGILGAPIGNVLTGRRVCLYGLGAIALPLAKRLKAFDVQLIGVTRNPDAPKVKQYQLDLCYPIEDRRLAFSQTDVLVLCIRYFDEMRDSIGAEELAALPRGSHLINVARGGLVDHVALCDAIQRRHIAGAGLDVFSTEPTPVDHPLLKFPNVIVTPHVAGVTEDSFRDIAKTVAANIERLRSGQPLLNRVV